jgi:mono/diheme cytochrome c family protein
MSTHMIMLPKRALTGSPVGAILRESKARPRAHIRRGPQGKGRARMKATSTRHGHDLRLWLAAGLVVLLAALAAPGAQAQESAPTPTEDRLAPPVMPAEPDQADLGALVYYYNCMSCHGDRGQGLTDEFRAVWADDDQNCWQAKCHGANHPSYGFELVRYVPPVVSESLVARYATAANLQAYISTSMPWQEPGILTEEEYWQVTAFVLRANGVETGQEVLGPENAAQVPVASAARGEVPALPQTTPSQMPPPHPSTTNWPAIAAAVLVLLALVTTWVVWRKRRRRGHP